MQYFLINGYSQYNAIKIVLLLYNITATIFFPRIRRELTILLFTMFTAVCRYWLSFVIIFPPCEDNFMITTRLKRGLTNVFFYEAATLYTLFICYICSTSFLTCKTSSMSADFFFILFYYHQFSYFFMLNLDIFAFVCYE